MQLSLEIARRLPQRIATITKSGCEWTTIRFCMLKNDPWKFTINHNKPNLTKLKSRRPSSQDSSKDMKEKLKTSTAALRLMFLLLLSARRARQGTPDRWRRLLHWVIASLPQIQYLQYARAGQFSSARRTSWGDPEMEVPQNKWFLEKIPLKWVIWGYPYFSKPPIESSWCNEQLHTFWAVECSWSDHAGHSCHCVGKAMNHLSFDGWYLKKVV